jgi:large subunit ribosomal protein L13
MTKIIDGTNATMGRLASYAAKQALKGEEIVILNSEKVIITGNKASIKEEFMANRLKGGSSQKGPKYSKSSDRLLKRIIRGMLPEHRWGRGRDAFKRIMCYNGVPKEYESSKKIIAGKEKRKDSVKLGEVLK